jgi:hypothetical protein
VGVIETLSSVENISEKERERERERENAISIFSCISPDES